MDVVINLGVLIGLLMLGLLAGGLAERRHLRSLDRREAQHRDVLVTDIKSFPGICIGPHPPKLMVAEVVIASDYLKSFLASLRQIFGGEMRSFGTLMIRGRREAQLRLIEQARAEGYNALCNLRLVPADIGGSTTRRGMPMVTVLASATAYYAAQRPEAPLA
jgi:uncharacterized protein YbjQ (UPF0145 family)